MAPSRPVPGEAAHVTSGLGLPGWKGQGRLAARAGSRDYARRRGCASVCRRARRRPKTLSGEGPLGTSESVLGPELRKKNQTANSRKGRGFQRASRSQPCRIPEAGARLSSKPHQRHHAPGKWETQTKAPKGHDGILCPGLWGRGVVNPWPPSPPFFLCLPTSLAWHRPRLREVGSPGPGRTQTHPCPNLCQNDSGSSRSLDGVQKERGNGEVLAGNSILQIDQTGKS